MKLAELIAQLNANIFLKEFSFSKNTFSPPGSSELELADHVIWIDDIMIVYQIKERTGKNPSENSEKTWFEKKVLQKAKNQIRDTITYLNLYDEISIENQRGHNFNIKVSNNQKLIKIIIHLAHKKLPEYCKRKKYYISKGEVGFIHIVSAIDYLNICKTLITPTEISDYFIFRQDLLLKHIHNAERLPEAALVGQFLSGEDANITPSKLFLEYLLRLKNNENEFALIWQMLLNFAKNIESIDTNGENREHSYYKVIAELGKLRRTQLKEINTRIKLCLEICDTDEYELPYRVTVPETGCGFVFIPIQSEQKNTRANALKNLTQAAKYDQKLQRCIGITFVKEKEDYLIDWCLLDSPWQYDSEIEDKLKECYPFRPVKQKMIPDYEFE